MGLKEKQAMANLDFSFAEKTIKSNTGKDVKITLDQESFSSDLDAILLADQRGAMIIANAIAKVCYNDLGKEAFNEKKVTQIVIKNKADAKVNVSFKANTLYVEKTFTSDDWVTDGEVKDLIENQL